MRNNSRSIELSQRIADFFGSGRCFLLAKGRVGLYVGLRALRLPQGSKIVVPGYTCMVVPSAIQYAGLTPIYVDIDPRTYNLDSTLLPLVARDEAAAVIVQHTYGIPSPLAAVAAWASPRGMPLIEDACHTFGSRSDGKLCGTFGVFSFMSGQWNKPFSTGLGGILLVNDDALAQTIERLIQDEATVPGALKNLLLRGQILAYRALVRPATAMAVTTIYRGLSRLGLAVGSSSQQELRGEMPNGYLAMMARCQVRQGLRELARITANVENRAKLTAFYQQELPRVGLQPLSLSVGNDLPLLRYPVRVANKNQVLALARRNGVEIGSWFEVPLHPAGTRMEDFGYRQGMCPHAETACREVINLPTHLRINAAVAERTLAFLRKHARAAS